MLVEHRFTKDLRFEMCSNDDFKSDIIRCKNHDKNIFCYRADAFRHDAFRARANRDSDSTTDGDGNTDPHAPHANHLAANHFNANGDAAPYYYYCAHRDDFDFKRRSDGSGARGVRQIA